MCARSSSSVQQSRHTPVVKSRTLILILLVLALLVVVQPISCHQLERWFGPASVNLREAYTNGNTGPRIDHNTFDAVLERCVTASGQVRYQVLAEDRTGLDRYIAELGRVIFDPLPRNEKLALLINAYNAFTLCLILDHGPSLDSIRDIPEVDRWTARRWQLGKEVMSLDEIEHDYLRGRFKEPRIHFAINCASVSCPPLRREAYRGDRIEQQLEEQAKAVHANSAWVQLDSSAQTIQLNRLYLWFEGDFEQAAGSVLGFAARFHPGLAAELEAGRTPSIEWLEYDWNLNQAR